jgi:hypothetical protein
MIPKIHLKESTYRVYKTGLPFYDAARLIGVAHLFFGTASAEIIDKGAYWEIKGINIKRDEEQIEWVIERIRPTQREREIFQRSGRFAWKELYEYFAEINKRGRKVELKAEYDAALQIGTRGYDSLRDYRILAPRSTGVREKKFFAPFQEVTAATLGRGFAARVISRTKRQREEMYILPIFSSHITLSGFLDYERSYQHSAGGFVASVLAAISILLDLTSKKISVEDFAYTKEVKGPGGMPISSESGYLGFEKLYRLWWKAVEEGNEKRLRILRQIKSFLVNTRQETDSQNQELAQYLASFVVSLDVDSLCMVERLKARILASQRIIYPALNLFNSRKDIREVKEVMDLELPDVPENVSQALAKALELDEKGWMNQFTRLENATEFSQFISYIEHIISRGYYRESQEEAQADIRLAINRARELALTLKELHEALGDEKKFRAWKSIFLMDVLSRMEFRAERR